MRYLKLRRMQKKDLAATAGISISLISDITNGKGNPSLDTLVAIAKALEVPIGALLEVPRVGEDGWGQSLADTLVDDARLGLPAGYKRVSAIVTDHQAFQIAQWHRAAHARIYGDN